MEMREELRRLLNAEGILYASPSQPIRHRDGTHAPWAFYSWQVTLQERGLRLAASCILERLRQFKSTQLAAYGYTGQPLLSACVLLGGGRYSGLAVRERAKQTVACRQVDGPLDRTRPVILIDDSLSSGTSLSRGIEALEHNGFQVEGAIALVYFPGRGGLEWARSAGYQVDYLFDVQADLDFPFPEKLRPPPRVKPALARIAAGLPPAVAARKIAESYLAQGRIPKPPPSFAQPVGGQGGVYVSFRRQADDYRVARSGFWHFSAADARPESDLVQATILTLQAAGGEITLANLADIKIAVTFLGPLELIAPRELDFSRFGIVVRSRADPRRLGGALPNTQVFTSEIAQYLHARDRNARLAPGEPHDLFRHTIEKHVEPGVDWPAFGTESPPENRRALSTAGAWLTRRATAIAGDILGDHPPPVIRRGPAIPGLEHHFVAVSFYQNGFLERGISGGHTLAEDLHLAAVMAATALRKRPKRERLGLKPAVLVTVLHDPEPYGGESLEYVARKLRAGVDALAARSGSSEQILLPTALVHNTWSKEQFVATLAEAFPSPASPVQWTGFKTLGWLRTKGSVARVHQGFADRRAPLKKAFTNAAARRLARQLGGYVFYHLDLRHLPTYRYFPVADEVEPRGTAARAIHSLDALGLAGVSLRRPEWVRAARAGLGWYTRQVQLEPGSSMRVPGAEGGGLAECILLAALACSGDSTLINHPQFAALATRVRSYFHPSGAIAELPESVPGQLHDYLPGAALLAIGRCGSVGKIVHPPDWARHFAWCHNRFLRFPTWGMAGWLTQGWGEIHQLTREKSHAGFVFAVADWALDRQLAKNGAFLEELSPEEPSFNTGFIAEGIAAAWRTARRCGERARARKYEASWRAAAAFVDTLVIQAGDTFCMPRPEAAIGGVRAMPSRSDVRIDQVSHGLHALCEGLDLLSET